MVKQNKVRKYVLEGLFVLLILAAIALVYYIVVRDASDLLATVNAKDYGKIKECLQGFGFWGGVYIAILEMLQMIVVFIPAEFIQIAAGLSYPIYLAVPICVLGICMGATVIFLIVRCLNIRLSIMERKSGKIQKLVSSINQSTPMTVIMYLLFVMPMIPFGAICYFASSSDISYRRYIAVVATGVLPSVLSSFILGNVMYQCIGLGETTFILAVVIVVLLIVLLLLSVAAIIKNIFFCGKFSRPSNFFYHVIYFFVNIYFSLKFKLNKKNCCKIKDKSYVKIGRHTSAMDFYFTAKSSYPKRITVVANEYYTKRKGTKALLKVLHVIPKKLFTADVGAIKSMLEAKKAGAIIDIRPEGRLSTDGTCFPAVPGTASLIKKLGLPVYMHYTVGGYFLKPKWRSNIGKNKVYNYQVPVFTAEELKTLSVAEIELKLNELFVYDECAEYAKVKAKKNSVDVRGLEGVLYRCPKCGEEHCLTSTKTTLTCSKCGNEQVFNDNYLSDGKTISQLFKEQVAVFEKDNDFNFVEKCEVRKLDEKKGEMTVCGNGECVMKDGVITFNGEIDGEQKTFTQTLDSLFALAFSVNEEFEFYVNNVLYYFYPEHREKVIEWSMAWDILQQRKALLESAPEQTV